MDPPAAAAPRGVYYGWYVLGVVAWGAFLSAGTAQLFMSTMLQPMSEEFGWSRTASTGAISVGTLAGGLVSPWIGRLADRYGPRWLTTTGAVVLAGAMLLLAALTELWQLYAVYIVGRAVASTTLAGVVPSTAAANWFRRLRGRTLGIVAMAIPLGVAVLAFLAQLIVEAWGWRAVFVSFAAVSLLTLAPLAVLVLRRRPEDLGLRPDGDPPRATEGRSAADGAPRGWSLAEAQRTRSLWLLIAASMLGVLANTAVGYHQVAYYLSVGIAPTDAVLALSLYSLTGAVASGGWGWLTERMSERILATITVGLAAVTCLYLLFVTTAAGAVLFAMLFGLTSRGEGTLINIIVAQYFGRRAYGAINGFMYPFIMVGLGLGPFIASVGVDLSGNYTGVLLGSAGAFLLAAMLLWLARKPTRPIASAAGET